MADHIVFRRTTQPGNQMLFDINSRSMRKSYAAPSTELRRVADGLRDARRFCGHSPRRRLGRGCREVDIEVELHIRFAALSLSMIPAGSKPACYRRGGRPPGWRWLGATGGHGRTPNRRRAPVVKPLNRMSNSAKSTPRAFQSLGRFCACRRRGPTSGVERLARRVALFNTRARVLPVCVARHQPPLGLCRHHPERRRRRAPCGRTRASRRSARFVRAGPDVTCRATRTTPAGRSAARRRPVFPERARVVNGLHLSQTSPDSDITRCNDPII